MNQPNTPPRFAKKLERFDDPPSLRTCHDVRRLAYCHYCEGCGDKENMVPMQQSYQYAHGRCYVAMQGIGGLLEQPMRILERLTLGDIGVSAMKAIMARRRA